MNLSNCRGMTLKKVSTDLANFCMNLLKETKNSHMVIKDLIHGGGNQLVLLTKKKGDS